MIGVRRAVMAGALAAFAGAASAHGVSPHVDAAEDAVDAARGTTSDAAILRALDKMSSLLDRSSNGTSVSNEAKSVSKSAKVIESSLGGTPVEQALRAAHDAAASGYYDDLVRALAAIDAALAALDLPAPSRTKLQKARDAVDGALTPFRAAAPDPSTLSGKLAILAQGLKAAKGFTAYDGGSESQYVLSELLDVAPADSLDLNGDGEGDNAMRGLGTLASIDVAALANSSLRASPTLPLLWIWGVHSLKSDSLAFAGLGVAEDQDADVSDNFSGAEPFRLASPTAADGRLDPRAWTRITKAKFRFELSGTAIAIGGFVVPAEGFVVMDGTLAPGAAVPVSGRVGLALPISSVVDALEAAGITVSPLIQLGLQTAADLDLDGNGSKDGLSLCLAFRAVTTGVIEGEK